MADLQVSILASEGKATVGSLQLAEHFGIRHHHVLRDIKAIIRKVPEIFAQTNFGFSEYTDETGRTLPAFNLTRDGFTLLAMGYNSARAIAWKIRYIEAFNALEKIALDAASAAGAKAALALAATVHARITPERMAKVRRAADYKARGLSHRDIGKLLDCGNRNVWYLLRDARTLGLGA